MTRVCANCESEKGILNRSDDTKSHGLCRRHFAGLVRHIGLSDSEVAKAIKTISSDGFCEDLSESKGEKV